MATDGILKGDFGVFIANEIVDILTENVLQMTRRGDTDLQALQVALKKTDDMNEEYMPAIKYHGKLLDLCVKEVVEATTACQIVITEGEVELQKVGCLCIYISHQLVVLKTVKCILQVHLYSMYRSTTCLW
jgi:hypothetical protein